MLLLVVERGWKSIRRTTPVVEFTGLALVGGNMEQCWDLAK